MASSFDQFLGIKYTLDRSENFDKYVEVLGINLIQRGLLKSVTPVIHYVKEGDVYHYFSVTKLKTMEMKFKLNEPFDFETLDSRKVKVTVTIDGNTLLEVQEESSGRKHTFQRTFTKDEFEMVMEIIEPDGKVSVTSKRWYKVK